MIAIRTLGGAPMKRRRSRPTSQGSATDFLWGGERKLVLALEREIGIDRPVVAP